MRAHAFTFFPVFPWRVTFVKANKNGSRLWFQDGDPSQNSSNAKKTICNCNCDLSPILIPPRSSDLNPIFHLVRCKLKSDALALNITKETLEEFRARIMRTIYSIPVDVINRTIASMPVHLQVIDSKGCALNITHDSKCIVPSMQDVEFFLFTKGVIFLMGIKSETVRSLIV